MARVTAAVFALAFTVGAGAVNICANDGAFQADDVYAKGCYLYAPGAGEFEKCVGVNSRCTKSTDGCSCFNVFDDEASCQAAIPGTLFAWALGNCCPFEPLSVLLPSRCPFLFMFVPFSDLVLLSSPFASLIFRRDVLCHPLQFSRIVLSIFLRFDGRRVVLERRLQPVRFIGHRGGVLQRRRGCLRSVHH